MSTLVLLGSTVQVLLAAGAAAYSITSLWQARTGHAELHRRLRSLNASDTELAAVLDALSRAESEGVAEMERVLRDPANVVSRALGALDAGKRKAVARALTQPSDSARKRYLISSAAAA